MGSLGQALSIPWPLDLEAELMFGTVGFLGTAPPKEDVKNQI